MKGSASLSYSGKRSGLPGVLLTHHVASSIKLMLSVDLQLDDDHRTWRLVTQYGRAGLGVLHINSAQVPFGKCCHSLSDLPGTGWTELISSPMEEK